MCVHTMPFVIQTEGHILPDPHNYYSCELFQLPLPPQPPLKGIAGGPNLGSFGLIQAFTTYFEMKGNLIDSILNENQKFS